MGDRCGSEANSTGVGIGGWYNSLGKGYSWKSQDTWTLTTGATNGDFFRVKEYEVFSVHWKAENYARFEEFLRESKRKVE